MVSGFRFLLKSSLDAKHIMLRKSFYNSINSSLLFYIPLKFLTYDDIARVTKVLFAKVKVSFESNSRLVSG